MQVVVESPEARLELIEVRARDLLAVRLRSRRLDSELAAGAEPESRPVLAIRAQMITRVGLRQTLADTFERIQAEAIRPRPDRLILSRATRRAVQQAGHELAALAARLRDAGPVTARGMALVVLLLTEAGGPLHLAETGAELRRAITDALHHLDHPEVLSDRHVSPA